MRELSYSPLATAPSPPSPSYCTPLRYVAALERSGGAVREFVNPKYTDGARSAFSSPTRLECMMQDYPKLLSDGAKVGFTVLERKAVREAAQQGEDKRTIKSVYADWKKKEAASLKDRLDAAEKERDELLQRLDHRADELVHGAEAVAVTADHLAAVVLVRLQLEVATEHGV